MIGLSPTSTPPALSDLDRVVHLIAMANDPKACAERLQALNTASSEAAAVVASADEVKAGFAKERKALADARIDHANQIKRERAQFDTECVRRERQIKDTEAATARLQAEAQAMRDEAARLTEDLRLRLERVRSAAA